ncbi:uncharacterized protein METZ01_LOCUS65627 [marine metagenome]|jgi:hypothetical protein|uniref:Uncharacterized protein n=1 Tax=marine metagenome TaxID=408172 RepID=A0A381TFR8_9ZZZZ|tara:strand:- start:4493 stop:4660 length:168 start_codon:yes stop_codon:yes gene_type:complete
MDGMKNFIFVVFLFTSILSGAVDTFWTKSFESGSGDEFRVRKQRCGELVDHWMYH